MPADWISGLGLARGATALIHDSQYTDDEYPSRRGWGHSRLSDTLAFAQRARPERLLLFHHDPSHDDAQLQSLAREAGERSAGLQLDSRIDLAREGRVLDL
jgi:ribonuclease BN (tRNA processing enzyme)